MTHRTCPVAGCDRALGTTKNGDPWAMCRYHYGKLDNPHRIRLWIAYRAWQRLERAYLKAAKADEVTDLRAHQAAYLRAHQEARTEAIKSYIAIRDLCIEMAGRGEAEQLELAQ